MRRSQNISKFAKLLESIDVILDSFKKPEFLSEFEQGQRDGLLWVIQIASDIDEKTPSDD